MAKVLQLRRGTTAQNNAFTGLAGELTMDTESKTLRIHDGETLGGFTVGKDAATGTGTFDITTVPDEFWAEIVARHAPSATLNMIETDPVPTENGGVGVTYVIDAVTPIFVQAYLVCKSDTDGYVAGDVVAAFGIGNRANPQPYTYQANNKLYINMMIGGENWWVSHKNTGVTTTINNANWSLIFRVYY